MKYIKKVSAKDIKNKIALIKDLLKTVWSLFINIYYLGQLYLASYRKCSIRFIIDILSGAKLVGSVPLVL